MLCDDLDGWGGVIWEGGPRLRGDICIHVADLLLCIAETNTSL